MTTRDGIWFSLQATSEVSNKKLKTKHHTGDEVLRSKSPQSILAIKHEQLLNKIKKKRETGSSFTAFCWIWCSFGWCSRHSLEEMAHSIYKSPASIRRRWHEKTKSSFTALCWRKRERNFRNIAQHRGWRGQRPVRKSSDGVNKLFYPKEKPRIRSIRIS
jgi:hypothetical protein